MDGQEGKQKEDCCVAAARFFSASPGDAQQQKNIQQS